MKLNEKYPGFYYVVSDYGYGDGGCYGPFTAEEALKKYMLASIHQNTPFTHMTNGEKIAEFEHAIKNSGRINYISDYRVMV